MGDTGYIGRKVDGSSFHVFNKHWKWIPLWTGEGLPPAGICELRIVSAGGDWHEADIKFASRNVVVWDWVGEPSINGLCTAYTHAVQCRPIRTPEQIAAEERRKSAIALYEAVMNFGKLAFDRLPLDRQEHYLKLVDAGWQQVKS